MTGTDGTEWAVVCCSLSLPTQELRVMKRFQDLADAEQFVREFLHYFMINLWNTLLHRLWMQLTRQIHGRKLCWLFLNAINLPSAQEDHWRLEGLSGRVQCMFPLLALLWYYVFIFSPACLIQECLCDVYLELSLSWATEITRQWYNGILGKIYIYIYLWRMLYYQSIPGKFCNGKNVFEGSHKFS